MTDSQRTMTKEQAAMNFKERVWEVLESLPNDIFDIDDVAEKVDYSKQYVRMALKELAKEDLIWRMGRLDPGSNKISYTKDRSKAKPFNKPRHEKTNVVHLNATDRRGWGEKERLRAEVKDLEGELDKEIEKSRSLESKIRSLEDDIKKWQRKYVDTLQMLSKEQILKMMLESKGL